MKKMMMMKKNLNQQNNKKNNNTGIVPPDAVEKAKNPTTPAGYAYPLVDDTPHKPVVPELKPNLVDDTPHKKRVPAPPVPPVTAPPAPVPPIPPILPQLPVKPGSKPNAPSTNPADPGYNPDIAQHRPGWLEQATAAGHPTHSGHETSPSDKEIKDWLETKTPEEREKLFKEKPELKVIFNNPIK